MKRAAIKSLAFAVLLSASPAIADDCLPPIHQENGARAAHDDYRIGKVPLWPFNLIPREWTSFCADFPPVLFFGNQKYWNRLGSSQDVSDVEFPGYEWGPKPIPRRCEWQISLLDMAGWIVPYFAITTCEGLHFRIGARWTDGPETYITFPSIAFKRIE